MKRLLPYALLVAMFATLASLAYAQLAPLPEGKRFDQKVEFQTSAGGESLRAMIAALAKSVGLTPVVNDVPDNNISYDIGSKKPFRQVWNLVLTLNGLDYVLLPNDIVVVGTPADIAKLEPQKEASTPDGPTSSAPLVQRFYRVNNKAADVAKLVQQAVPGAQIEVIGSLNVISVRGTQKQQDQVAATLAQFDKAAQQVTLEQRVYPLSNAKAEDLAKVLQQSGVIGAQSTTSASGGTTTTSQQTAFNVVADARTNSLIVTAPADLQAQIAKLIPKLDKAQKQVNVQVRIQAIDTTTAQKLGINLSAGLGNFATTLLNGTLNFIFDAQKAISGLNIGATLDTLEKQGLSKRVDDSNLTMLNNQTGTITSGGTLTIPPQVQGAQAITINYGVTINVTPQIANDGRITLNVIATVSDLTTAPGDPQVNISNRSVSSTVTVEPGQTIVLGGLLENAVTKDKQGVPILSSIPLIGSLFSTTSTNVKNSDLLLVINAMTID
jgi:type II secretory pathway component GspD/PulD (secretin)